MIADPFKILFAGLSVTVLLASCGGGQEIGDTERTDDTLTTPKETEVLSVGGRLFSIPSPVQAALAIKQAGLQYRNDLGVPLQKLDSATGKVAQAALLGAYGADLAYATVNGDGQRAMATLVAIEKLGSKLDLSNAFDKDLMDQFRSNLNNEDSLLRFSGKAFGAADRYLKTNDREDVSTLVLAGGWVESIYLLLSDPNTGNDQKLIDRIGDQKNTLDGLIELLTDNEMDQMAEPIMLAMKELRTEFDSITRTYHYETPVTDAAKKVTYINSRTTVQMPPEKVEVIRTKVEAVRNLMIPA